MILLNKDLSVKTKEKPAFLFMQKHAKYVKLKTAMIKLQKKLCRR